MPHVPHLSKVTWAILLGGAVAIGLYLRHRAASNVATNADTADSSSAASSNGDLPNLPDTVSPYDTISGTDTTSGGGGGYPYPAGGPGNPIRIIIKEREPKKQAPKKHPKQAHHRHVQRARSGGG
jgi:hypothetical protein